MFYSQDLLCKRGHRFGTIWLLATTSERCRWRRITANELGSIDIPTACQDLLMPRAPMALRLTSTLLIGLARAFQRKATLLYTDCHSTWLRVMSAPWIIDQQKSAIKNATTAATTHKDVHLITLADATVPMYSDVQEGIDMQLAIVAGSGNDASTSKTIKRLRELGWICPSSEDPEDTKPGVSALAAPHTSDWASISLPDSQVRHAASPFDGNSSSGSSDMLLDPLLLAADDDGSGADEFEHLLFDAEVPIHFDHDGNTQFANRGAQQLHRSHTGTTTTSAKTELLFLSQIPVEGLIRNVTPANSGSVVQPTAATGQGMQLPQQPQCLDLADHAMLKLDDADPAPHVLSTSNNRILEEIEDSVLRSWPPEGCGGSSNTMADPEGHRPKRRRMNSNGADARLVAGQSAATYERHVADLWGDTCYWQGHHRFKALDKIAAHRCASLGCRISLVTAATTATPAAGRHMPFSALLGDPVQEGDIGIVVPASSPKSSVGAGFDYASISSDEHFELEMGRAESPSEVAQRMLEREEQELQLLNVDLDIPWLSPNAPGLPRRLSGSIRAESSPGLGSRHGRSRGASVQSTPSRILSLDPSSADELEVQSFELTAAMPAHGDHMAKDDDDDEDLEGFLDISHVGNEPGIPDDDSRKFYYFVISKFGNAGTAEFADLVQPPHNKRRIAARAFMDLLQMATRSVFNVCQTSAYSSITISLAAQR
ncbi:R8 protein [Linderina macrospora]|uniref:R8 protein n=1 Tax=Linderina macrospora TaxID=4868 RepID=A0ACC1JGD0_9FUNG|nr:R8 protein [Linderina macrospora]